ncbi:hypothetical protein BJY04DRAFT_180900 [Aspergillus karnatakaensis]|uniref:uncharacterized protein n=1 Tax=Aspergillus karnatakaensis TaxID=1810916 RepID=UPI003CCDEC0D
MPRVRFTVEKPWTLGEEHKLLVERRRYLDCPWWRFHELDLFPGRSCDSLRLKYDELVERKGMTADCL